MTQALSPEQTVTDRALSAELEQAVLDLDPKFSTVLLLVGMDGLNYSEVADVLGVAVGTVTSRLSRARTRVRHILATSAAKAGRST